MNRSYSSSQITSHAPSSLSPSEIGARCQSPATSDGCESGDALQNSTLTDSENMFGVACRLQDLQQGHHDKTVPEKSSK